MKIHLIEYLDQTVKNSPEATAIIDHGEKIDFKTLAEKSKILSAMISEKLNHGVNSPVAVYMEKSISCILSDIGILYSGNAYMNLNVKAPLQRVKSILNNIRPMLVITNNEHVEKLSDIGFDCKVINIDEISFASLSYADSEIKARLSRLISVDPSCIINTSGSTGTPKSVILNHMSFIDFTERAAETFNIKEKEIIGSLSPVVFDIYSFELCMLMAKAATIVVIPEGMSTFPLRMLDLMNETKVSFVFWVPTIMVNIANMGLLEKVGLPNLKTVWFAGEVFPTKQLNVWRKNLKNTVFINLYGPIEITLDCTYFIVDRDFDDDDPIPIGFPFRNTNILILNEDDKLADINEEGEICVRGVSLAMGYYNNPEKTRAAFTQNPLQTSYPEMIYRTGDIAFVNERGEIIFRGRKDTLVKHMGYRIELAEIEHIVINMLKLVENACVVYDNVKNEIVLFYEPANKLTGAELRKSLNTLLPKYMLPAKYVALEEMPRNPNGKIDRLMLKNKLMEK